MQITRRHTQRLRQMFRSAGWPFQDVLEAELLAAGLLERERADVGCERLRVTDAGVAAISESANGHRAALSTHEALVQRVAAELSRAGRIVWRGPRYFSTPARSIKRSSPDSRPRRSRNPKVNELLPDSSNSLVQGTLHDHQDPRRGTAAS